MVNHFVKSLATIGVFLVGCNAGISDHNLSYISAEDAVILLRDGKSNLLGVEKKTILIDPRNRLEYSKKHIAGSTNIPFGHLFAYEYKLENAGIIIVSGETDNDPVAMAMSKELMKLGFKDVKTLRGGLDGWWEDEDPADSGE